eukprot:CAMPEP_0177582954 /NCGR_PEP_ID=MMETSP0419_2-20121207/3046_1 /TAXON_ID=582737 /ORGANISM="Tetraselmis sp., Strain GSL018" /LENGTH=105 /DNA_ID=CAMNT_0019072277 /DNA_START=312 /DNA_END=626 /DNA_ORIENTATION=-
MEALQNTARDGHSKVEGESLCQSATSQDTGSTKEPFNESKDSAILGKLETHAMAKECARNILSAAQLSPDLSEDRSPVPWEERSERAAAAFVSEAEQWKAHWRQH